MKKTLILFVTCLALPAWSQVLSNGVALHLIPSAATPLTGAEIVPMSQITSGTNATKSATVSQINAIPLNFAQQASNTVSLVSAAMITADGIISNKVNTVSNTANAIIAGALAVSNTVNASISSVASINAAESGTITALNIVSNSVTVNTTAIGGLGGETNRLESEIATVNAALGLAVSNSSSATFTRLSLPATTLPMVAAPSAGWTNLLDFSQGSQQIITVGLPNTSNPFLFTPTNYQNGDNLWLMVICTNNQPGFVGSMLAVPGSGVVDVWTPTMTSKNGGMSLQLTGATKKALLNWQVISNNLIFTMATHF